MPLYRKSHSWGEFVFDWSWAQAYAQAGLRYYPKLVSMTPFTPATGPRLLVRPRCSGDSTRATHSSSGAARRMRASEALSSAHLLFGG